MVDVSHREARRTGLNVCVEGIKPGADDRDTWIKSLQEIHRVTYQHAKSIAQEYPSIKSLYEAYQKCSNIYVAQMMLEDVPVSTVLLMESRVTLRCVELCTNR